jgi:predicted N-formylglutamate amidohydrolase
MSTAPPDSFIITCEHGGNRIPAPYRQLFQGHVAILNTHRGFDPGALLMAKALAKAFDAPLVSSTVSRLLIDLNRSPRHPHRFSEATAGAPVVLREEIAARYYHPYRAEVERLASLATRSGARVIHVSSHSFTPELNGIVRQADLGLLYDPSRPGETELCARWQAALALRAPALRVRRNYPYTGKSDGLTTFLRRRFTPAEYVGIELEINQRIVFNGGREWASLRALLVETLVAICSADAAQ